MSNWKGFLGLMLFLLTFVVLLWVYDPENIWFQWSGTIVFTIGAIFAFRKSMYLKGNLDTFPFVIEKGRHSITQRRPIYVKKSLRASFHFTSEHRYSHTTDSAHINKLIGISSLRIHKDSLRVGWRHIKYNRYNIYMYAYVGGVWIVEEVVEVVEGEWIDMEFETHDSGQVYLTINDKQTKCIWFNKKLHWVVFPYVGDEGLPAPHRMEFDIDIQY